MDERRVELEQLANECISEAEQYYFKSKLTEALIVLQKAKECFFECKNLSRYAFTLNFMGVIYSGMGNEAMEIDSYQESYTVAMECQDYVVAATCMNNVGSTYQDLKQHDKAMKYFIKAQHLLQEHDVLLVREIWHKVFVIYMNIVTSNIELGNFDEAWLNLKIAERYLDDDVERQYSYYLAKSTLLYKTGYEALARENLDDILELAVQVENASDYKQNMGDLCKLLSDLKEYDSWEKIINVTEKYSEKMNSVSLKMYVNELWMQYYKTIGDEKSFVDKCVEHTELYFKEIHETWLSRSEAIDVRIELSEKEVERRKAKRMSTIDPLTGLGNRSKLAEDVLSMIDSATYSNSQIGVGILDIDYFKKANDTYGHICGDHYLIEVADAIKHAVGEEYYGYRFGGDEFVILMPDASKNKLEELGEILKKEIESKQLPNEKSKVSSELTISQGYVCITPEKDYRVEKLIDMADKVLYKVKSEGRNSFKVEKISYENA